MVRLSVLIYAIGPLAAFGSAPSRARHEGVGLGVPGRIVRPVDDALRERIESTWTHYVMQARAHRAGRYPLLPPTRS